MSKRKHSHDDQGKRVIDTFLEASRIVGSGMELQKTLDLLLEQLSLLVEFDSASILIQSGETLSIAAGRGYPQKDHVVGHVFNPAENPIVNDLVANRIPVIIPDVSRHAGWQTLESTKYIRSWMGVPLLYKNELVGLLSIDKGQPYFFNERSAKLARAFANHAALAIANARSGAPATEEKSPLIPRGAIALEAPILVKTPDHAAEGREALLFGKILVQNRLATQEQVDEAISMQQQLHANGICMKLGAVMFDKGFMSVDTLYAALMIQKERFAIDSDPFAFQRKGLTPEVDSLLGEWAIERGLITRENLSEALAIQQRIRAFGVKSKRVGEILVDKGYLSSEALVQMLEEREAAELDKSPEPAHALTTVPVPEIPPVSEPTSSLAGAIRTAVETAPTALAARRSAYAAELRAARRRLFFGFAAAAFGIIVVVIVVAQLTGGRKEQQPPGRPVTELVGYTAPPAPSTIGASEARHYASAAQPVKEPPLSPLEQARSALLESLSASHGWAALLCKPVTDNGQTFFLLEGGLPFQVACQGSAVFLFAGREIAGTPHYVVPQPHGFSAAVGPIPGGKKIVPGIYTAQVELTLDLAGDGAGGIVYVPDGPETIRPPTISFPMRFTFYMTGKEVGDQERNAIVAFLGRAVAEIQDAVASLAAQQKPLRQTEDAEAAWTNWKKEFAAALSKLDAVRQDVTAFASSFWVSPYDGAVAAVVSALDLAGACVAHMNAGMARDAGKTPTQHESEFGLGRPGAVVLIAGAEKDEMPLFLETAQAAEKEIAALSDVADARQLAAAAEYVNAMNRALRTACKEAQTVVNWIKEEAPRRKSQHGLMLSLTERFIKLWQFKVGALKLLDAGIAKMTSDDDDQRGRLEELDRVNETLSEVGAGAIVDVMYECGFLPSAEIAALSETAARQSDLPALKRLNDILGKLESLAR